jgi:hypothetical protein
MQINIKDVVDFSELPNWKILLLMQNLTTEFSNHYQLPELATDDIKDVLYDFEAK